MLGFFIGLSLGLLIHRQGHRPLLRFPLRCWFFGHTWGDYDCIRCHHYDPDPHDSKFVNTFWTI